MKDIHNLLNQIAAQEAQLGDTQFLAPCVRSGRVRTRVANIIYTFTPQPPDFEGWGIFQPVDGKTAEVVEEPSLPQLAEYLKLLKPLRLRLAHRLRGQTWLAYPVNESDMQQRFGNLKPVPVHLVTEGAAFEPIIARFDGSAWWFDEIDRRAEPQPAEHLREYLRQVMMPENIRFAGITPEMQVVYDLALQQTEVYQLRMQHRREVREQQQSQRETPTPRQRRQERRRRRSEPTDEERLQEALHMGGGELQDFRDRGDFWQVEWTTRDGEHHTSAIAKSDLTVISSGICLSGYDRNFDLQSLVGVIEGRDRWD
ncbi:MAG TPA: hypothetical protein DDZ80_12220 [Cyanobacteria bacterium UBA8803]|nr:hypothetical protein [Cyanobacteria bacterium UBA9273]HBL59245.1 hypothetical protein [Cyanobacteria bacterium UBA8803]